MSTGQPYAHDAMATPDDPTPGGPMTHASISVGRSLPKLEDPTATDAAPLTSTRAAGHHDDQHRSVQRFMHDMMSEAYKDGFLFSVALDLMREGCVVARKGWPKECEGGIYIHDGQLAGAPVFIATSEGLALPMKDIMAEDWMVL